MRRRLAYVLVWMLATTVTVGASWLGIRSVLDAAAPRRSSPLSAADLRRAVPTSPPVSSPAASPAASASPTPAPSPSATSPLPSPAGSWLAVANGERGPAYQRTFHVQGGAVTFRIEQGDVRVLDSKPKDGFEVMSMRLDPESLRISFVSSEHTSRVYVEWRGGPYAEITESVV